MHSVSALHGSLLLPSLLSYFPISLSPPAFSCLILQPFCMFLVEDSYPAMAHTYPVATSFMYLKSLFGSPILFHSQCLIWKLSKAPPLGK